MIARRYATLARSRRLRIMLANQHEGAPMKAEPILAKLNELRHEAEDDKTDIEYLALHHAFCFVSYKTGEFQKYLDEVAGSDD